MSIKVQKMDQPELAKHDSSVLDLVFAMDCTGSMGSYIETAQKNIRTIAEEIVSKEKSDVHFALVEYRDHPPQDSSFVTRVHDFTSSVSKMKTWLDAASADGGGDTPEAVADALHQVLKLNWRKEATKICVFIADAPPHGLGCHSDGFPNGCPDGLDPIKTGGELAEKCITMYMVGCEPSISPYKEFFMAIAHMTGGQYVPLRNAALLSHVIIGGAQEEISLQRLMEEVNEEVVQEYQATDGVIDEEEMSRKVMSRLNMKGFKAKQMQMNSCELQQASGRAKMYSMCASMVEVKKQFAATLPKSPPAVYGWRLKFTPRPKPGLKKSKCSKVKNIADDTPQMQMHCSMLAAAAPSGGSVPATAPSGGSVPGMGPVCNALQSLKLKDDKYEVVEGQDISYAQAQRMVMKSMAVNKYK